MTDNLAIYLTSVVSQTSSTYFFLTAQFFFFQEPKKHVQDIFSWNGRSSMLTGTSKDVEVKIKQHITQFVKCSLHAAEECQDANEYFFAKMKVSKHWKSVQGYGASR